MATHPVSAMFNAATREYSLVIVEDGAHVEVDRLPSRTSAGGRGSLREKVETKEPDGFTVERLDRFVATLDGREGHVPPGVYLLDRPWIIDRPVTIRFAVGATLVSAWNPQRGSADGLVQITASATLHDLTVDGANRDHVGVHAAADGIHLRGVTRVSNTGRQAINAQSPTWDLANLRIEHAIVDRAMVTRDGAAASYIGAVRLRSCNRSRVHAVVSNAYGKGIAVEGGGGNHLSGVVDNTLADKGDGVHVTNSRGNTVDVDVHDPQGNGVKLSRGADDNVVTHTSALSSSRGVGSPLMIQGGSRNRVYPRCVVEPGAPETVAVRVSDHPAGDVAGEGNVIGVSAVNNGPGSAAIYLTSSALRTIVTCDAMQSGFSALVLDLGVGTVLPATR